MSEQEMKTAADICVDAVTLASIQIVHVDAGLATWHDVAETLERALEAARAAA